MGAERVTGDFATTSAIDQAIRQLRKRLTHPEWIETVRGVGYRWAGPSAEPLSPIAPGDAPAERSPRDPPSRGSAISTGVSTESLRPTALSAARGFFYRSTYQRAEVSDEGSSWFIVQRSTIVATRNGIEGFFTSYRIDDVVPGTLTERVEGDVTLETVESTHPRSIERFMRLPRPLLEGEEAIVTFSRRFRKTRPQLRDMLVRKGAVRCDQIELEAHFDVRPASAIFRVTDRGELMPFVEEELQFVDENTLRRRIATPDPELAYGLYWTYLPRVSH